MSNFDLYYQKEISPLVNKFEVHRKLNLISYKNYKYILIASAIAFIIIFILFIQDLANQYHLILNNPYYSARDNESKLSSYIELITISFIILGVFSVYKIQKISAGFSYFAKTELLNKIIKFYPEFEYKIEGVDYSIVANSGLFDDFDVFSSEDSIQGSYKGIFMTLSEIGLAKIAPKEKIFLPDDAIFIVTKKESRTPALLQAINLLIDKIKINKINITEDLPEYIPKYSHQIFKGLFVVSSINKKFSSSTYILPNSWMKISNKFSASFKRVKLEDPNFEKEFDVYSDNQIEARYLLTPSFMERLVKLNSLKSLRCCFIEDKLFIALNQQEDFLLKFSITEVIDHDRVKKILTEIQIFFDIIDALKLDINIGL